MRTHHVQTLLMTVVIWLTIGVNIVCIWHCHTMHMELPSAHAFVCTHPSAPAHETVPPITYETLTQLSQLLLVTGVLLCVTMVRSAIWEYRCLLVNHISRPLTPPPLLFVSI